jgi:oligopeptide/dipeptide ABC transporter ATP-binding protein
MQTAQPLLEVEGLQTVFMTRDGIVRAVDDFSCTIAAGETLGVVGESGCGKSVTALSILRLIDKRGGTITGGAIRFRGQDLASLKEAEMRRIRGNRISMIFQEPMTSLNPVLTIGRQISESITLHLGVSKREARTQAVELLAKVRIPDPQRRFDEYPHQLSGGMRQRAMIAIALACRPALLIADEPTTALDVTIQAQIIDLLKSLQQEFGMAILLITHDLGLVSEAADRAIVMYAGKVVEQGPVAEVLDAPMHPYTRGLLAARPALNTTSSDGPERLAEIPGTVPVMRRAATACTFAPRCFAASDQCRGHLPPAETIGAGHSISCFNWRRAGGVAA